MSSSSPLRVNDLPAEWERSPMRGDEMAIRRRDGYFVVKAVRSPGDEEWRLELQDSVGNRFTTVRPVGSASGKQRAAEQLFVLAELVNEMLSEREEVRADEIVREAVDERRTPIRH